MRPRAARSAPGLGCSLGRATIGGYPSNRATAFRPLCEQQTEHLRFGTLAWSRPNEVGQGNRARAPFGAPVAFTASSGHLGGVWERLELQPAVMLGNPVVE